MGNNFNSSQQRIYGKNSKKRENNLRGFLGLLRKNALPEECWVSWSVWRSFCQRPARFPPPARRRPPPEHRSINQLAPINRDLFSANRQIIRIENRVADPDTLNFERGIRIRSRGKSGSGWSSKSRSFKGSAWSFGGPWTLTMEAWRLKMGPWGSVDQR